MTKNMDKTVKAALIAGGTVAAVGIGAVLLDYLGAKTGGGNAALVPKSVEEQLDRVVGTLNQRFGKRWVTQALSTLQAGLAAVLPAPLVALLKVVHQVEVLGQQQGWSGQQKKQQAVQMSRA